MTERRRRDLVVPVAAVVVALLLPLAILLGTAFLFGLRFQPVETNSMAPGYPAGSLAVVQPLDVGDVEPGMIIVFADSQDPSRLIAHRVVKQLTSDPPAFQTKGDANATADPFPVPAASVRGKVTWAVAGLGGVVTTVRGAPAVLLLVVLPLGILVVTEVLERRRRRTADHERGCFLIADRPGPLFSRRNRCWSQRRAAQLCPRGSAARRRRWAHAP